MPRVRLFHWKAAEAAPLIEALRSAKFEVDYEEKWDSGIGRALKLKPPAAVVIDLSRLPSHGREIAIYMRGNKITRAIPIVFAGGAPEKVEMVRQLLPDATYTAPERLRSALRQALANKSASPVVPPQVMDRYVGRTAAQKLGIVAGSSVALFDAPRNYAQVIGDLPAEVTLDEDPDHAGAVTLWFVRDPEEYLAALPQMRKHAARSKLWILWPKTAGVKNAKISESIVREFAIEMGLVDYKVCSVDPTWSALAFARKKL